MLIAPLMIAPLLGRTYEPFLPHMRTILAMTKRVMDGYALAWTMTDREVLVRSWTWIAVLVAIGLASLPLARGRAVRQPVAFFLVLFAATLLQLFLTWQARAVHHTISLWPWHLLLIGLVARDLQAWGDTRTRWMRGALVGVFLVLVAGQVRSTMSLVAAHRFERGFHPNWDPAIYQLSAALEREYGPTRLIMSTDWGLHTPLHALAALTSRDRYRDAWLPLMTIHRWSPLRRREWALQLAARDTLVLTFTDRRARFTTARRNLFELADEQGLTNVRLRSIAGADGRALYEIHRFERPAVDAVRPRSASVGEGSGG
jgi:hypothetical protein